MKKILIIVIILAVAGVGAYFVYNSIIHPKAEPVYTYEVATVTTNMKNNKRIVKTQITLEIDGKKSLQFLDENKYKVRDTVISVLRSKSAYDYDERPETQEEIRAEIVKRLKQDVGCEGIRSLYFNEFATQ